MQLIENIERTMWEMFSSYQKVEFYIKKWYQYDYFNDWENFTIENKEDNKIDLLRTLHNIDGDLLIKIAVDLGIETPDFIPSIPIFRNTIKADFPTANATFEKAFKDIEEHPDVAIGLANSALESIIKEILKNKFINSKINSNKTLYDLTQTILKEFSLFPNVDLPQEIKTIGSSLLSINKNIEKLRSEKTNFHGKTIEDYMINDSIYTYFIINTIATIGLFLISFYKLKISTINEFSINSNEIPF